MDLNILLLILIIKLKIQLMDSNIRVEVWNSNTEEFIPISNIPAFKDVADNVQNMSLISERARLQGKKIRLGYYSDSNMMKFEENSTKISGLLGELWTILSAYLNFTLEPIEVEEVNFGHQSSDCNIGLIGMLKRNEIDVIPRVGFYLNTVYIMDYSTPLWKTGFRVYVQPEFTSDDSWVFKIFPITSWLFILGFMTIFSIIGALHDKYLHIKSHMYNFLHLLLDHYFYTFGTFCNQGQVPEAVERQSRIMAFSRRMCAFLVISIFSTTLVASMTHKEMNLPFFDVASLVKNTNYRLGISNNSLAFTKFHNAIFVNYTNKEKSRLKYVATNLDLYRLGCDKTRGTAVFGAEDRLQGGVRTSCTLMPTGQVYFSTWATTGMSKGFTFKRSIDNGLLKFIEVGLLSALKSRWLARTLQWPHDSYESVGLQHVYVIFVVLLIGMITSIMFFIIEHIIVLYRRIHLRKKWNRQLRKRAHRLNHKKNYTKQKKRSNKHYEKKDDKSENNCTFKKCLVTGASF